MTITNPTPQDKGGEMHHTPTPWEWDAGVIPPDGPERYSDVYATGEDGELVIVARFNDCIPQGRANARLMVEAVNSHSTLTEETARLKERVRVLEGALEWALPLAEMAVEDHRLRRIKAGHTDITGTYKSGETWAGIHQSEVDAIERARSALHTTPEVGECPRCVDWQRLDLSDSCPSCDAIVLAEARK